MSELAGQFPKTVTSIDTTMQWFIPALAAVIIIIIVHCVFHSTLERLYTAFVREISKLKNVKDHGTINLITTFCLFVVVLGGEFTSAFLLLGKALVTQWHVAENPVPQTIAAAAVIGVYSLLCLASLRFFDWL